MAIIATNDVQERFLIPAGNYIARCYGMVEVGTVKENFKGQDKMQRKVRIFWELPTELREFKDGEGEKPCGISKEFTVSMHEKANLRKVLESWRGQGFTEQDAKAFDITKLLGAPCMLNIIHETGKTDPSKIYAVIASVSRMPKGMPAPAQVNKTLIFEYDKFDQVEFEKLPDWLKNSMKTTPEYIAATSNGTMHLPTNNEAAMAQTMEEECPF